MDEMDKELKNMEIYLTELKETCDEVSKNCKEMLKIIHNPILFMLKGHELDDYYKNIQLKFLSLGQLADLLSKDE